MRPTSGQDFEPVPRRFFVLAGLLVDSTMGTGLERQEKHSTKTSQRTSDSRPAGDFTALFPKWGRRIYQRLAFLGNCIGELGVTQTQQ